MLKRTTALAAGFSLAASLALAACGSDESSTSSQASSGGNGKRIAAVLYGRDVPFFQDAAKGIEAQAKEYGWDLDLQFSKPEPTGQIDLVTSAVAKRPDGLILVPIDREALVPAAREAKNQNIPVIALADGLGDPSVQDSYVGGNFEEYGKTKAEFIAKTLGGKGKVGFIHGVRGLEFSEDQFKGAKAVFEGQPGIEIVDGPYAGGFSADQGLDATQNLITANPDLDAIFFDNDDLALGGIQAARDRGIDPDELLTVGTDGTAPGLEAVRKGELDYTLSQCAVGQGREAVIALHKLLVEKADLPARDYTKVIELTPDNIEEQPDAANC